MLLSIHRPQRTNRRLPKRFRDLLPEPPLPLPPQDVEVPLEVNIMQANPGTCPTAANPSVTSNDQFSSREDGLDQSAELPSQRYAVVATKVNSFGLFRLYDENSIPSTDDPEDQSRADPLPTIRFKTPKISQPLPSSMNLFYPYPNENSWCISDWYWNKGTQKSQNRFKKLMEIITSPNFRTEDLYHTNWTAIDHQLGSLETVHGPSQAAPDLEEWQTEGDGWMQRDITISVPFPRRFLNPGPRNYTISNFYRRCLLSIIREVLSDPVRCKTFRFEPYSLRWKRSCDADDIRVYGELFSSQAFIVAHCNLQDVRLDSTDCTLPRRIVALMFWSDATQLTAFGDAKLWPLYVYFGNESKYQCCTPTMNCCSHAAYFQTVCVS